MKNVSSVLNPFLNIVNLSWLVLKCILFIFIIGQTSHVNGEQPSPIGICAMSGCNCTIVVHHWINVKCIFSDYQDIELHEGTIPSDALEVSVSRCRELKIHSGAFTGGAQLKRVFVTGIKSFVAKRQAFHNITSPNPLLEVSECNRVVLESHAFKNAKGTLSVSISRCKHVEIKPNAFSWLLYFSIREVPTLDLSSNAFKFDAPPHGRHGPATTIMIQNSRIQELPSSSFPSSAAEIKLDNVWIKTIRKDAFCPVMILEVKISNASIVEVESGAFSDETLITNFELVDVRLSSIRNNAFRAGFNNFVIQYSRLEEIETRGIEISAATVALNNNEFHNLEKHSIILKQWNRIIIDHNEFKNLEEDAIKTDEIAETINQNVEFSFRGNRITKVSKNSLKFASISEKAFTAQVGNNYFGQACNCYMEDWIRDISGKNTSATWMMDSSYCLAGDWLEKCLKIPQGYLSMKNFTETICNPSREITCKEPSDKPAPSIIPPSVGPHIYPEQNKFFNVELSDSEQLERETRLIVIGCFITIFIIIGLILTFGIFYIRRRGNCLKLSSGPLLNLTNSWLSPTSGMTAATSARSISRLSVNEYAGLRPETRILNIEDNEIVNDIDGDIYAENKATQTLPEELTEEYLTDLRERLNDPEDYGQAREIIEHLYDLIKVEENCNNNNDDHRLTSLDDGENPYDVIEPKIRRSKHQKPSISIGTKVPSLEKLLPINRIIRPPIVEYTQPRDQRTQDQNHLYAELPGDETVPSTSRLSQSILDTLTGREPQPLPPDVVNDHIIINDKRQRKYSDTEKSFNFLKTFGITSLSSPQSQLSSSSSTSSSPPTKNNNKRPESFIGEYSDPNSSNSHLYAEPNGSSTPASKMANRPLPTKPDQENINLARV